MGRIRNSRYAKMTVGIVMTLALVLSLFAGVGTIWVNEDTDSAYAGVVDPSNGKYNPTPTSGTAALGSSENPFVVLEIVPNENMAQFGYLVNGQEPVDLRTLAAEDESGEKAAILNEDFNLTITADKAHRVTELSDII